MATASLLETISVLKGRLRSRFSPPKPSPLFQRLKTQLSLPPMRTTAPIKICPQSTIKPSAIPQPPFATSPLDDGKNPLGGVGPAILEALRALRMPAAAAATVMLGFLVWTDPLVALAASGGRMGGSNFSSYSSSSSSSSSSTSHSSPSSSTSYSLSWSSYNDSSSYGDSSDSSYSYSISQSPPRPVRAEGKLGSCWSGFFLLIGAVGLVVLVGVWADRKDEGSVFTATPGLSIHKIQVGLLGMARSLQKDLDQIAETADTSTSEGLHYVLTETALALLRHPACCISAYSSVDVKRSIEDGEKRFNQLSIEERGKFDEETLVNVNNIRKQKTTSQRSNRFDNEYIVITILAAVEGVHKLPVINGSADLKEALHKLGSIPSSKTLAVEVLWTPQNENDTLTEQELLEDYPLLRAL